MDINQATLNRLNLAASDAGFGRRPFGVIDDGISVWVVVNDDSVYNLLRKMEEMAGYYATSPTAPKGPSAEEQLTLFP